MGVPKSATACTIVQTVKARPTPMPWTIGMTKLVPPAANRHLAKFRLALAAADLSEKTSTRYVMMIDCVETAVQPVMNVEIMGIARGTVSG